jgi:hypothetical protein
MNTPRALLGWATDPSTYTSYAIGGHDNNGTPLAMVEAYNLSANTWSFDASLPETLYSELAVGEGAGHIYTFGGAGANGAITNAVYCYTIATNTWAQVASMPVAVRDSAAVLGPNGLIYVLDGTTASATTAAVESYNSAANTWNVETSLPQAVSSEAAAVDSLGRIEVLGGYDVNGNATASIFVSQKLNQADLAPTLALPRRAWASRHSGSRTDCCVSGDLRVVGGETERDVLRIRPRYSWRARTMRSSCTSNVSRLARFMGSILSGRMCQLELMGGVPAREEQHALPAHAMNARNSRSVFLTSARTPPARRCQAPTEFVSHRRRHYSARTGLRRWWWRRRRGW